MAGSDEERVLAILTVALDSINNNSNRNYINNSRNSRNNRQSNNSISTNRSRISSINSINSSRSRLISTNSNGSNISDADKDYESGFDFSIDSLDYDRQKLIRSVIGPLAIALICVCVFATVVAIDGTEQLWTCLLILVLFLLLLIMAASCTLCCGSQRFGRINSGEWFVAGSVEEPEPEII